MGVACVVPLSGKQVPKARYRADVCSVLLLFLRAIFTLLHTEHSRHVVGLAARRPHPLLLISTAAAEIIFSVFGGTAQNLPSIVGDFSRILVLKEYLMLRKAF